MIVVALLGSLLSRVILVDAVLALGPLAAGDSLVVAVLVVASVGGSSAGSLIAAVSPVASSADGAGAGQTARKAIAASAREGLAALAGEDIVEVVGGGGCGCAWGLRETTVHTKEVVSKFEVVAVSMRLTYPVS